MYTINCPHCGLIMQDAPGTLGRTFSCPRCRQPFSVPASVVAVSGSPHRTAPSSSSSLVLWILCGSVLFAAIGLLVAVSNRDAKPATKKAAASPLKVAAAEPLFPTLPGVTIEQFCEEMETHGYTTIPHRGKVGEDGAIWKSKRSGAAGTQEIVVFSCTPPAIRSIRTTVTGISPDFTRELAGAVYPTVLRAARQSNAQSWVVENANRKSSQP